MPFINLTEYKQHAQYLEILGRRIAYWTTARSESKETLLFIHGFPSAAWDWHPIWEPLSEQYHLIALDLLGYGLSEKPHPHNYTLVEQAEIIDELMAFLEISECHILAHDYGDSVAQELLFRCHKKRLSFEIESLVFLNGGLFSEVHRALFTQKLLKSPIGPLVANLLSAKSLDKSFTRIFGKNTPPKKEEISALWALMQNNDGARVVPSILKYIDERLQRRADWLEAMTQTSIPQAFINGKEDPISGEHMRQRYEQLIPNPVTFSLDFGHYPQLELPDEVLKCFAEFQEQITSHQQMSEK